MLTIGEVFRNGGPILYLICAAGVAAVAIFIERVVRLRQASIRFDDFLTGVFNILEKGKIREATALCDDSPGPVVKLMRAAIVHREEPRESLRQILENTGRAEIARMERRLAALSTITHMAPLLGLVGTLLGALRTVIAMQQGNSVMVTADFTPGLVEAIGTSIAGLAVAIPAYAMYNILVVRIDRIVLDMEQASGDILAFMARWSRHHDASAEEKDAK